MKDHYLSWRAQLHFELSNVVNGQKIEKLLALNKAKKNLRAIYGPIAIKLLIAIPLQQPLCNGLVEDADKGFYFIL